MTTETIFFVRFDVIKSHIFIEPDNEPASTADSSRESFTLVISEECPVNDCKIKSIYHLRN